MKRKLFMAALVFIIALALFPSFALADGALDQLKADIAAAPVNGTETRIELTGNITGFTTDDIITIQKGQNIVLDMNGYSITVADDFYGRPLMNYGTLTMTGNGTIDSSVSDAGGLGAINNYGTLTIENGTYKSSVNVSGATIFNRPHATLIIKDGKFDAGRTAVYNAGDAYIYNGYFDCRSCSSCNPNSWGYTIQSHQQEQGVMPNLYFYNGTVIGVQGAFSTSAGYTEIHDGTFETVPCANHSNGSTAHYALYVAGESGVVECNVYGGTFKSVSKVAAYIGNNTPGDGGDRLPALVNIYDGSFTGGGSGAAVSVNKELGGLEVVGGTFSSDITTYVSGAATVSTDGTTVTPNTVDSAVASIERGGKTLYYTSLNDAVAEARDGETVKVLESTTISSALEIKNNITIDGNGNTVTANKCVGLYIRADLSKLTVSDLTLKGVLPEGSLAGEGSTGSFMGIGTYNGCYGVGDLQLTNVTIDGFSYGLYFGINPAGSTTDINSNPVSVTANDLTVQNCYIKGAYFEKLTDSSFTSCKFVNNGTDETKVESGFRTWMCGVDINLKNGSYENISFIGCTFTNNGKNNGTALLIKARDDGSSYGSNTSLNGVAISGCAFSGNNGSSPVIIGEPGKGNKTPVNVSIQSDVKYTSNVAAASNFTITFNSNGGTEYATQLVAADSEITLPTPSKSGYIFLGWRCGENTCSAGATVKVTADMAFAAVWANMPDVTPDEPEALPFTDVSEGAWYYGAVCYVWENGIMEGVETDKFAPNSPLTRAMVWAILARLDGVEVSGDNWMTTAQEWAVRSGVSDGENPTGYITREQLVTMLWRYAGGPVVDYALAAPDADQISDWALEAMRWAASEGIIEGDDLGNLNPAANSTRAHAAAFMQRFQTAQN